MELSKEQKLDAYTYARDVFQAMHDESETEPRGICGRLARWLERNKLTAEPTASFKEVFDAFPEFVSFKPDDRGYTHFWFDSYLERVNVLNKCIDLLNKK